MTAHDQAPKEDAWLVAVHGSRDDVYPLGAGILLDDQRVLTCAHVVTAGSGAPMELWVAFPMSGEHLRIPAKVVRRDDRVVVDLAVLRLGEPAPAGFVPAPLRCPKPAELVNRDWWAFGFPEGEARGNAANGKIGASLAYGWIRLDTDSPYPVEPGFSGSGLWSPDYEAVVGIVGAANDRGDGQAITLHQADAHLPDERIRVLATWDAPTAGEMALASWGWTLAEDPESDRHWRPRARGVAVNPERGYRFRGRYRALTEIVSWLDGDFRDQPVLVVTGSPGVGKSAVVGRIVTTADADLAAALPADDDAVRASVGSVACAVHAKGKTALDVAMEIARAASAPLPERLDDFPLGLREALAHHEGRRFNLVVDALDEATDTTEARMILREVILPMVRTCSDVGARVVVGTRPRDDGGDLLPMLGPNRVEIDLDQPRYFSVDDLERYAQATLQLRGSERSGNPYEDDTLAVPLSRRIASLADRNFLVAGLMARAHGLYDDTAVPPDSLTFTSTVESALSAYLNRLQAVGGVPPTDLLTVLAFAEAPGLTSALWRIGLQALFSRDVAVQQLADFAGGAAGNFLVQSGGSSAAPTYRLFHQALSEGLVKARRETVDPSGDERSLTRAFHRYGAAIGWRAAPEYAFRSLPGHAVRASMIDELLTDDEYLLYADLRRLIPAAGSAITSAGMDRARLLRLTPRAIPADPLERIALFSVTEALEGLGNTYQQRPGAVLYRANWGRVRGRVEHAVLEGHAGDVWAVCPVEVDGTTVLASAGDDRLVWLWDPVGGEALRSLGGHTGGGRAVCALQVDERMLLASAGNDRMVILWHPVSGEVVRTLEGHTDWINSLCPVQVDGRVLLASAGNDRMVILWDPVSGEVVRRLEGHVGAVRAVSPVEVGGRMLLASAGDDGTTMLWDPVSGEVVRRLEGHVGAVRALIPVLVGGRMLLASAGDDRLVRLWDPVTGEVVRTLEGPIGGVRAVCPVPLGSRVLLASAGDDGLVRMWDPATGEALRILAGHTGGIRAVCSLEVDGRTLVASVGADGLARLWDPVAGDAVGSVNRHTDRVHALFPLQVGGASLLASGGPDGIVRLWDCATGDAMGTFEGHTGGVHALSTVQVDGSTLLASAGYDGRVRLWDPATESVVCMLEGHTAEVRAVCPVEAGGRPLLASAGDDGRVRLWDPASGHEVLVLEGHTDRVRALCPVEAGGRTLLASAGDDGTVRMWDPASGHEVLVLEGHTDKVRALCPVEAGGQTLLASAGDDRTVRLWQHIGMAGRPYSVPVHHRATALAATSDHALVIGLSAGLLVLSLGAITADDENGSQGTS